MMLKLALLLGIIPVLVKASVTTELDDLNGALRATAGALRIAENKLADATATIQAHVDQMDINFRQKDAEIIALRQEIADRERTLMELRNTHSTEMRNLNENIRGLQADLDVAREANAIYLTQIRDLQQQLDECSRASGRD